MAVVAKHDENHVATGLAVTNDVSQTVSYLLIDPVTGFLLIANTSPAPASTAPSAPIPRDVNRRTVVAGVSSVDKTTIIPISVDPATGNIIVTFV
jgi:hypothetical protein